MPRELHWSCPLTSLISFLEELAKGLSEWKGEEGVEDGVDAGVWVGEHMGADLEEIAVQPELVI